MQQLLTQHSNQHAKKLSNYMAGFDCYVDMENNNMVFHADFNASYAPAVCRHAQLQLVT